MSVFTDTEDDFFDVLGNSLKERLSFMCTDAMLDMVFEHNFMHGDLHPGNILVAGSEAFNERVSCLYFLSHKRNKEILCFLCLLDPGDHFTKSCLASYR